MVLLTEFTNILPGRALLGVHGANVYIFGPLAEKAIGTLLIKKGLC